ncbi:glutamate-cysteine ligase family protein [Actinosynnema sp. NPDC059797]
MTTSDPGGLVRDDLGAPFRKPCPVVEKVGLEVECGVVDPVTGLSAPYSGERGTEALLRAILREFGGEPLLDDGHLVGVRRAEGVELSLEHGGAIEYGSAPAADLASAVEDMRTTLEHVADIARGLGLAILPGGNLPFDRVERAQWVPKPRGALMREFFAGLGDDGALGPTVMALTVSTQATLDYLDEADLARKLRMQVAASPVVAALFVNSPLAGGEHAGLLSHRSHGWLRTDPRRCGVLPVALRPDLRVDDFVEWALDLPMIYRKAPGGGYERAPSRPFAALLEDGFDDGTRPTPEDWVSHLSQVWTDVRVRHTLELRAADGPPYPHIPALPALWTGLTYHPGSCAEATELLGGYREDEHRAAERELPVKGLDARLGDDRVRELAVELVRIAGAGLRARVDAGLERPAVLDFLQPVEEVLETGDTFAHGVLRRWEGEFDRDPARYVAAYRV